MLVYRLSKEKEVEKIFENHSIKELGSIYREDNLYKPNNHNYIPNKLYLHFFDKKEKIFYLDPNKGKYICVYDIPNELLEKNKGIGYYEDNVEEYAIESNLIDFEYLIQVDLIESFFDYEDYLDDETLSCYTKTIYKKETIKKLKKDSRC